MFKQSTWKGEKAREISVHRPCDCGCDDRHGHGGVGYLTGSTKHGNGFTIWIESEAVFAAVSLALEVGSETM